MAHILVSVYSVFFQPHSTSEPITINNIHIIDLILYMYNHLLWLFPCTFFVYDPLHTIWSLTPFPLNYLNETKRLNVEHYKHSESANLLQAPIFILLTLLGIIGATDGMRNCPGEWSDITTMRGIVRSKCPVRGNVQGKCPDPHKLTLNTMNISATAVLTSKFLIYNDNLEIIAK